MQPRAAAARAAEAVAVGCGCCAAGLGLLGGCNLALARFMPPRRLRRASKSANNNGRGERSSPCRDRARLRDTARDRVGYGRLSSACLCRSQQHPKGPAVGGEVEANRRARSAEVDRPAHLPANRRWAVDKPDRDRARVDRNCSLITRTMAVAAGARCESGANGRSRWWESPTCEVARDHTRSR